MGRAAAVGLVLAGALALGGCQESGGTSWFEGDFAAAKAAAQTRKTLIIIYFYSDW